MAKIVYYKDSQRIDEVTNLLSNNNPLNMSVESMDKYSTFAECMYYFYIYYDEKKRDCMVSSLVDELLNATDEISRKKISCDLKSIYNGWAHEDNDPKRYRNLRHFKPWLWFKHQMEEHIGYLKGLGVGLLIMFLFMLEILLKVK